MPLTIYRRHSVDCRVHKLRLKAYEKKYFKDCDCPIWLTGSTDTEQYPRQALGVRDWPAAEAKLRSLNAASKDETVHGLKLDECITRYLDSRDDVKPKTVAQYKLLLGRLKDFAHGKNKFFIRELSVDLLEDFKTYGLAGLAGTSKGTSIAKLAHFLREFYRRGWITESLVDKMRRHKAVYQQKQPYTEKEVTAILDAAGKINGGTTGYRLGLADQAGQRGDAVVGGVDDLDALANRVEQVGQVVRTVGQRLRRKEGLRLSRAEFTFLPVARRPWWRSMSFWVLCSDSRLLRSAADRTTSFVMVGLLPNVIDRESFSALFLQNTGE